MTMVGVYFEQISRPLSTHSNFCLSTNALVPLWYQTFLNRNYSTQKVIYQACLFRKLLNSKPRKNDRPEVACLFPARVNRRCRVDGHVPVESHDEAELGVAEFANLVEL